MKNDVIKSIPENKLIVIIRGVEENHKTWNIFFEDIYINGKKVTELSGLDTQIGPFAEKVYIK